ncbi:MAG: PaaI family thioesterase, partial [Deltaproteobacteria bacterium]|nr:PaaI family thioesterase [Deltaproteobacteria bacterium]
GDGAARSRLAPDPKVCWPFPGQPHGGVLFTFMDTTMAWAVFSEVIPDYNCATISLDIQYTLPAKGKRFTCSARVIHRTGRTSFARADIRDEEDRLLALGQGTFRIIESDIMREAFDKK